MPELPRAARDEATGLVPKLLRAARDFERLNPYRTYSARPAVFSDRTRTGITTRGQRLSDKPRTEFAPRGPRF